MSTLQVTRLSLFFIVGYEDDGEPIVTLKQFRNIVPSAENESLLNTAIALASLQKHDLDKVERNNTYDLAR